MSEHSHASHAQDHGHDEPHVLPISVYLGVFFALVFFTAITVAVAHFDFGSWNTVVALLVATTKGSLVALYFMHLRYDNKFNLIVLLSGLLFLVIFLVPTLMDLTTRGIIDPTQMRRLPSKTAPATPDSAAHH